MKKKNNNLPLSVALGIVILSILLATDGIGLHILIGLLYLGIAYVLYLFIRQIVSAHRRSVAGTMTRDIPLKFIALLMGLFLLSGTIIYMHAFGVIAVESSSAPSEGPVLFSNTEYLFRAFICSLDLFMLDVDSSILDQLKSCPGTKGIIIIQAVLSFSCTIALLVSLVFTRLKAYYRLARLTRINDRRNHLYVFFGINEPSRLLARDTLRKDPSGVVVLVDEANINEDERNGWESIIGLLTHRRKTFSLAENIDADVTVAISKLCDIDRDMIDEDNFDVFGHLNILRLRNLIEQLKNTGNGPQLHIFLLSGNEDENIRGLVTLAKDRTIRGMGSTPVSTRIYCHARSNGPNRVVEDLGIKKGLDIRIVDSSHLAVELLKADINTHPVNVVRLSEDNPATVDSLLDCLIIGFGEVGRDSLRFLYEFGAFVDRHSCPGRVIRSPFRCTVIDSRMDQLKGVFMAQTPSLSQDNDKDGDIDINLIQLDYNDSCFFETILTPERAKTINYIVIAIGDDDRAIALATMLFNYIRRYRNDMDSLRMMVRCTCDENMEMMRKIATHYNSCYDAKGNDATKVMHLFGAPEMLYTYNMIVNDTLVRKGQHFYKNYSALKGEDDTWIRRRKNMFASPGHDDDNVKPVLDILRRLRRQESQDLANALHASTKIHILRRSLGEDFDWRYFLTRYFTIDMHPKSEGHKANIRYRELTEKENLIILHLAMLEHIRWTASHEMLGYTLAPPDIHECDERTRRHNCIRPWQELDDESDRASRAKPSWPTDYKSHDFSVVDTSIALVADELKTIKYQIKR